MERETVKEERKSKIFGNNQLKLLEERIAGSKDDPTGQFQLQVVPKVKEILTVWIPRKTELEQAIIMRKREISQEMPRENDEEKIKQVAETEFAEKQNQQDGSPANNSEAPVLPDGK